MNEKPKIVEPPADTVNPASAAEPPAALEAVVPSTLEVNQQYQYLNYTEHHLLEEIHC